MKIVATMLIIALNSITSHTAISTFPSRCPTLIGCWQATHLKTLDKDAEFSELIDPWDLQLATDSTANFAYYVKNELISPIITDRWYSKRKSIYFFFDENVATKIDLIEISDSVMVWGSFGEYGAIKFMKVAPDQFGKGGVGN
jgi:hypothetical protein